jgi:AcrR family transcriptional regulator
MRRKRNYESPLRRRQADRTRIRIVDVTRKLLQSEGYDAMTIEAIAKGAGVSTQSVYANFKSKAGILVALLDQSAFGADYEDAVQHAMSTPDAETRLRRATRIARQIHGAQSPVFDLLQGAGVVAPELAKLHRQREGLRYQRQERMIDSLLDAASLLPHLNKPTARDIFWMLTGRDVYRMLVHERGWSSQKYQGWLADTLVRSLLTPRQKNRA